MGQVRRIYVEKKDPYAVKAKELAKDIAGYLGINSVSNVRELIRYDIENLSEETYKKACRLIFSEPPVDILYEEELPLSATEKAFSVEYLPGQFDQRADSAIQCVRFLNENEDPIIRTAVTYVCDGSVSDDELERIKAYCINPVDSKESDINKPTTLAQNYAEPDDVKVLDGFSAMKE